MVKIIKKNDGVKVFVSFGSKSGVVGYIVGYTEDRTIIRRKDNSDVIFAKESHIIEIAKLEERRALIV